MNYLGVYHSDYSRICSGVCDAPCLSKGHMTLSAREVASEGALIAMVSGRLRNQAALSGELGESKPLPPATLALRAYRKWGVEFVSHLEGPVMSCLMDAEEDILVLSRDRMGEKPVYYAVRGDRAAFSDHPDALLKANFAEARMGPSGLREIFGLGPAHTPGRTPLEEVSMLEPGCALVMRGGKAETLRYFSLTALPHEYDEAQTIARTRALLEQAVDDIRALQPAVMLSGGLDSTALTALLAKDGRSLLSFSVDYQGNGQDFRPNAFRPEADAPYVRLAAGALHTQHRTVVLDQASLIRELGRAVSLRGFPGMADIDTSLLLLSEHIARFNPWVVSGECGDEVFCGYPWFNPESGDALDGFPWSGSLELRESLLTEEARTTLKLREYVSDTFSTHLAVAEPGFECSPRERRMKILQKLCFEFFMPNLQERAVRMCEGTGVRVLTPLCDDRLVAFVYNVPWEMKFLGGREKGLFRQAVRDLLPDRLLWRKKSPYPKTCSPQYSALARQLALGMLSDRDAPIFDWVDRQRVLALAQSSLNPAETPWFGQLMAGPQLLAYLWQINAWLRERHVTVRMS